MSADIHPSAIVSPQAELGSDVTVGAFSIVGPHVKLGDRVHLTSHVSIEGHTAIGPDTRVSPFVTLGHAPQDARYKDEPTELHIGARNTIREHVSMHRGTAYGKTKTVVGSDNLFMAGSHVAHDCVVGDRVVMANNATLGGLSELQDAVIMGGLSAIHQFCRVGFGAFIGGGAPVTGDVIPFGMVDNHGRLAGLNIVGLRRRGASKDTIGRIRSAYRLLFTGEGHFAERLDQCEQEYADQPEVARLVQFIRSADHRPLCMPEPRK